MSEQQIKPCPSCSSKMFTVPIWKFWLECSDNDCHYQSPRRATKAEAVAEHNRIAGAVEDAERYQKALVSVAIYDQDDRPLPNDRWDEPFDWRRRSMKQERIARQALQESDNAT